MASQSDIDRLNVIAKQNLADVDEGEIKYLYTAILGRHFKPNCSTCIDDAYYLLLKFARKNNMANATGKYRFTKKWQDKTIVVSIGGTNHKVTNETLSVATVEAILNNPQYRHDMIELNPDYTGVPEKKFLAEVKKPQPISSTSTEVKNDGATSLPNVSEKKSATKESKPLTEAKKKQGRPFKKK